MNHDRISERHLIHVPNPTGVGKGFGCCYCCSDGTSSEYRKNVDVC